MGKKFCFALLLFFALFFTVADSLFGFLREDGTYVTVPDFCGLRESALSVPQWATVETSYRYESDIPAGTVISQTPSAGSQLKVGAGKSRILTLTVSLGAEEKTVPNLLGQDARSASALLRDSGFIVSEIPSSGGTAGEVIGISPDVGTKLPIGSTVTLTVSQGTPAQTVTVPNLTGLSRSSALLELFRCGLTVGEVVEEASDAPVGTVIRQSPTAGSLVAPNTKIKITVSREMPAESTHPIVSP